MQFLLTSLFLYALLPGADVGKIALDLSTPIIRLLLCNFIILEIWFPEKLSSFAFYQKLIIHLEKIILLHYDNKYFLFWITFFFF